MRTAQRLSGPGPGGPDGRQSWRPIFRVAGALTDQRLKPAKYDIRGMATALGQRAGDADECGVRPRATYGSSGYDLTDADAVPQASTHWNLVLRFPWLPVPMESATVIDRCERSIMPALNVALTGRLTLAAFERTLAALYRQSVGASEVVFDLTRLEWCGHLPATLFFAWAATLVESKTPKRVHIHLPERQHLTPQVQKALVESGVLRALEVSGVEVPYSSYPEPRTGLPLTSIPARDELWRILQQDSERLLAATHLTESAREAVKDAFEVVLFELAENAFVHTNGSHPHYQVTVALSSGPSSIQKGMMAVFEEDMPYTYCMPLF